MLGAKKAPLTFRQIMRALGPGLVTGAADDDPSGDSALIRRQARNLGSICYGRFSSPPLS